MARGVGGGAARFGGRLDTLVLAGCIILALVASALPAGMRDPVASSLRRTIVAPLVGLQSGATRWRSAWLESERKSLERDSLALQVVQAQALTVENERLRKLLGLGSRLSWGFIPAEALHTSGRGEDVMTTLTLTAGSSAGVAPYSPVIAPEGIVGLVQNVDPNMSTAILYSHPDFRVSAMSMDSVPSFGIVYPHLDARGDRLAERYLLELRNVPSRNTLKPGTAIFSTGLGGAWPRGVLIGTVVRELSDSGSWMRTYIVRPAVNPAHTTSVMILTPRRRAQGVGNLWSNPANVAAATRTVVAAGDSLAREASRLEAAARRAAMDSVRRASVGDSVRLQPDSATLDSIRRARTRIITAPPPDTAVRRDTARRDTTRPDTTRPPAPPDTIPPGGGVDGGRR
jgi:rod shape-determining protein MreC